MFSWFIVVFTKIDLFVSLLNSIICSVDQKNHVNVNQTVLEIMGDK